MNNLLDMEWRVGIGRPDGTRIVVADESCPDLEAQVVGTMATPELAERVVKVHNLALHMRSALDA